MRYHWGFGVGHTYSYQQILFEPDREESTPEQQDKENNEEEDSLGEYVLPQMQHGSTGEESGSPPSEPDTNDGNSVDGSDLENDEVDQGASISSDEEFFAMDEMYGDI